METNTDRHDDERLIDARWDGEMEELHGDGHRLAADDVGDDVG